MKKKFIASVLVLAMVVGSLAGCGKKDANTSGGKSSKEKSLVVASGNFNREFSPFTYQTAYDHNIIRLTQADLFPVDREGVALYNSTKGEKKEYEGKEYTYTGLADLTVTKNTDTTVYNIKLRDDVKFSDGEKMTIDDVIFNYYVMADTSYTGMSTFSSLPIVGMQNYRYNSTLTTSVKDEEVQAWFNKNLKSNATLASKITEAVTPLLTTEFQDCKDVMGSEEYKEAYKDIVGKATNAVELFINNLAKGKLDPKKVTEENVVAEVAKLYGVNYKKLSKALVFEGDGTEVLFDDAVNEVAKTVYLEEKKAAGEGKEVPNIEGIKKINDYELEVTTEGFSTVVAENLSIYVCPMHYYGDKSLYDYDNNKFGFTRGDISKVEEKSATPVGAGPYVYKEYKDKIVYLDANKNYYKGEPKTKEIQYKETQDADNVPGVGKGTIDVAEISGSKETFKQIEGLNSNKKLDGNVITTARVLNPGYGYIGINSDTIKVGKDGSNEASKAFRKGIATILSVYREVAIDSYYGDAASVIDYAITNTSWAAPKQSDPGYTTAFSTDVNGKPIYTSDMKSEDKFTAAKKAALGYFQKAGCTISNNKITKAPAGTPLKIEVMIGGGGSGDHPAFGILTDSKKALAELGIELIINDMADTTPMFEKIQKGQAEMFVLALQSTSADPDLYQKFHSSMIASGQNDVKINDKDLDKLIDQSRSTDNQEFRKATIKKALDIINDWAVQVPVYQRENATIFSSERVNTKTLPENMTTYYGWYYEVEKIEMK